MTKSSSLISAKNIALVFFLLFIAMVLVVLSQVSTAPNLGSSSVLDLLEERERSENLIAGLANRRQAVDELIAGGYVGQALNEANLAMQDLLLANQDFEKMVANGNLEDRQDANSGLNTGIIALEGIIEAIRASDPLEADRLDELLDELNRDLGTD